MKANDLIDQFGQHTPNEIDLEYEARYRQKCEKDICCWLPDDEVSPPPTEVLEAEHEIYAATIRIAELEAEIAQLRRKVHLTKLRLRRERNPKHEMKQQRGRPARNPANPGRETAIEASAKRFTRQWVSSLQKSLGITTCTGLADQIPETEERTWRRWLAGDSIPTPQKFLRTIVTPINRLGGKTIGQIPTDPRAGDLYLLLRSV